MKFKVILFIFISTVLSVQGQMKFDKTIYQPYEFSEHDYNIVNAKENGLLVFREKNGLNDERLKDWEFYLLDTGLNEVYHNINSLDTEFQLIGYEMNDEGFYMLYQDRSSVAADWLLIELTVKSGVFKRYQIKNELEVELSHFKMAKRNAILGGEIRGKPAVIHYSISKEKVQILPGLYRPENKLVDIRSNLNGTFNVVFIDDFNSNIDQLLRLRVFSSSGSLLIEGSASFPKDIRIHSGTTTRLKNEDLIIIGTYGSKSQKISQGVYFLKMLPGDENKPRLTEFSEMDALFKYLGDRREERIREKISEAEKDDPYVFRAYSVIWDVRESQNNYYVFAEVINPSFDTNVSPYPRRNAGYYRVSPYFPDNMRNNETFNDTGRYYTSDNTLLSGLEIASARYESANIFIFDRAGNFISDLSLEIQDIDRVLLEKVTSWNIEDGQYQLFYKEDENLHLGWGELYKDNMQDSTLDLEEYYENSGVLDEKYDGKIEHWWGNHFYLWGYRRIKDSENIGGKTVFYVQKVTSQ